MNNKTIIRFSFCDIQTNQGLGKRYLRQPDNPSLHLDYSGFVFHKTKVYTTMYTEKSYN